MLANFFPLTKRTIWPKTNLPCLSSYASLCSVSEQKLGAKRHQKNHHSVPTCKNSCYWDLSSPEVPDCARLFYSLESTTWAQEASPRADCSATGRDESRAAATWQQLVAMDPQGAANPQPATWGCGLVMQTVGILSWFWTIHGLLAVVSISLFWMIWVTMNQRSWSHTMFILTWCAWHTPRPSSLLLYLWFAALDGFARVDCAKAIQIPFRSGWSNTWVNK